MLIILVICLAIICICDLLIGILKVYQWWLDKKTKKYEVAIGRYDAELNRNNRCLAIGKGGLKKRESEMGKEVKPEICLFCKWYNENDYLCTNKKSGWYEYFMGKFHFCSKWEHYEDGDE